MIAELLLFGGFSYYAIPLVLKAGTGTHREIKQLYEKYEKGESDFRSTPHEIITFFLPYPLDVAYASIINRERPPENRIHVYELRQYFRDV